MLWLQLLVAIIFVIACIAANKISVANRAMGFAIGERRRRRRSCPAAGRLTGAIIVVCLGLLLAVWTALLCILISIGGTLVMKKVRRTRAWLAVVLGADRDV